MVSIGMPVYNGANYIRRSSESILDQDYQDLELIISDNGSSDETESICRELAEMDKRIRYYRNETNLGAARNYNRVFELARGNYFKWAAHDDECSPSLVRRCVETFENGPAQLMMVYPSGEMIDEQSKPLFTPLDRTDVREPEPDRRLARLLPSMQFCDTAFGMFKTESLKKTRLIGCFFGADLVLLAETAMQGEIWQLDEVLFHQRSHPGRAMTANRTARERVAWFNPAAVNQMFVLGDWEQLGWQLFRAVGRSSLPTQDKLKCYLVVQKYYQSLRPDLKCKMKAVLELIEGCKLWEALKRRKPASSARETRKSAA
jgi:glycosyltransferase involved in cell wall biosynthesis